MKLWDVSYDVAILSDIAEKKAQEYTSRPKKSAHCSYSIWGVTGATGRVGRHFIRDVLRKGEGVVAVVRANGREDAQLKFWSLLTPTDRLKQECIDGAWHERVNVIAFEGWLSPIPDCHVTNVFHAAGQLSWLHSLEQAQSAHVNGAMWALRWAEQSGAMRLDVTSTLSVWVSSARSSGLCFEHDNLGMSDKLFGTYAASKWMTDKVLDLLSNRVNIGVASHRLGLLLDSQDEGWALGCPVAAMIDDARRRGAPQIMDSDALAFDWTPMDKATESMMAVIKHGGLGFFAHAATKPMSSSVWHGLLVDRFGGDASQNQQSPDRKMAMRAWGRALYSNKHPWWADVFQCDRHRFDRSFAIKKGAPTWSAPELSSQISWPDYSPQRQ